MGKQIRMTSVFAFAQFQASGGEDTWRERCLSYLKNHEATDGEAMRDLGVQDVNCYRPVRTRLAQAGLLQSVGRRRCEVTGKVCMVWTASSNVNH